MGTEQPNLDNPSEPLCDTVGKKYNNLLFFIFIYTKISNSWASSSNTIYERIIIWGKMPRIIPNPTEW